MSDQPQAVAVYYAVARLPLGHRITDGERRGSVVRRAAPRWVDRNVRPPMVRWDGKIDAEVIAWETLAALAFRKSEVAPC